MRMFLMLSLLFFLVRCDSGDNNPVDPNNPINLTVETIVYEDKSGIVFIKATAEKATEFYFDMGVAGSEPILQTSGDYEHTYKVTGSYNIEVRAYGSNGRYLKKQKNIVVTTGEIIDIEDGYSTPLNYQGMKLTWNDEFSGTELNLQDWSYDNGNGCPNLCGWGNNELEYYRSENSWLENGSFVMEAKEEDYQGNRFTSTKVVTRDKQAFQYGRFDIRAKLPKGQGIWPAFWLLGSNQPQVGWPKCGEIDIMEMIGGKGRERSIHGNAFWDRNGVVDFPASYTLPEGNFYDAFHVFSIIWDEEKIRYFVDDNEFHSNDITTPDKTEFHQPFYFIMNIAVGGNWPGSPDETTEFPTKMYVDYVRVFQKE